MVSRNKRRRAVRIVDKSQLKDDLFAARDTSLRQQDDFYAVGVQFFCSDSVIDKLCKQARFIESQDD